MLFRSLAGLADVIAVDPLPSRCAMAEGRGATEVWATGADEAAKRLDERTKGRGADIVFDITGNPSVFHAAQRMLAKRGRLGLIGDAAKPSLQTMTQEIIGKSARIVAAHGSMPPQTGNAYFRWGKREQTAFFFEMIRKGRIDVDNLESHVIAPERAPETYADILVRRGMYMGVFVDWNG